MPTGYTAAVHDGKVTDFYTFAWTAARAMGAFVCARDSENTGREPTLEELDELCDTGVELHRTALIASTKLLAELEAFSDEQWREVRLDSERREAAKDESAREESAVFLSRYQAMLAQVDAWSPPTADHTEFKAFMRDQLVISMNTYCGASEIRVERSDAEFKEAELSQARWECSYYTDRLAAATKLAERRRSWILALAASLRPRAVDMSRRGGPSNPDMRSLDKYQAT